ncbi:MULTISPECIES: hypothetical protein [Phyllobacteriaceae]|jgi:hypothetical protein|uniref:Uncharacterized protein n=1 Tax=Mesorhizobium hungaricum TaxID=1566387 RepID=A0A1C2DZ25_9HYPH|nr:MULTISPECIES: hypothetical protein [Mesorhizobium]MBN9234547.1 hypothetical protein [Mesorhizobium sp.]MDQ0328975.1 hypothetical protein [Mesorhizobium sp. YL-MeA3-2017]OCX20002.1 hypothetical protein QV13_10470 [Mesorhizobium hungaricum]
MLRGLSHHAYGAALIVLAGWLTFGATEAAGLGKGPAIRARHGAVPVALVGKWGFAATSGEYCDPLGACAPGSGGSISFTFRQDGRAEYSLFQSSLIDGCGQVQTLTLKTGTVTVNGSTLLFMPKAGSYKSVNGCRPDLTGSWKFGTGDLKPVSFDWQLEDGQLSLVDPGGEASGIYSRR